MSIDDRPAPDERNDPIGPNGRSRTGPETPPPRWAVASFLYARALALVVLCAFVSLGVQIEGLYGDRGLTPVHDLFAALRDRNDFGVLALPTLVWLAPSATTLGLLCVLGVGASGLLFLGIVPRTALLVAWAAYLSLVNAGLPWTAFQWDLLLVEVLLASTLFVPATRIDRFDPTEEPSRAARWLLWLLIFRLMFRSGVVKLASGDPRWADLTALDFHAFTQPLPTVPGWYAAHLPLAANRIACGVMFAIELGLPFLVFIPRRWARRAAASGFAGLMLLIGVTGNYGFFNLLTLVLCIPLIDDAFWRHVLPKRLAGAAAQPVFPHAAPLAARARSALAWVLVGLGLVGFVVGLARLGAPPSSTWLRDPLAPLRPFRSVNDYGLFAVMTTQRREIELEGSADGRGWKPYLFRYKVGPLERAPVWCAPHQPRLDWQMWFAALDPQHTAPWLERLMEQLVVGEPAALALLGPNPFPAEPPRFVRATLYDYRPTSLAARARTGAWWTRERIGPYGVMVARGERD